jgi:hypothetical protein
MEAGDAKEGWLIMITQNQLKLGTERDYWEIKTYQGLTINLIKC